MKVSELITELQKMPQDATACIHSTDENFTFDIDGVEFVEKYRGEYLYGKELSSYVLVK